MKSAVRKVQDEITQVTDLFKDFPLFQNFPDQLKAELAKASEIVEYPVNSQILKQGQTNHHLYFLVTGKVGIYVDGARVSKLQRKGDLLGEMSVIANGTVGATVLAETQSTVVRVDSNVLLNMQGPDREVYVAGLYRIYSTVLAEKLNQTNQKAKHFEELTVQLTATQAELRDANANLESKIEERTAKLEQQKAELVAGKNKVEDLLNSKRTILQKLTQFHDRHLAPLKTMLDGWHQARPEDTEVSEGRRIVFEIQQLIGPFTEQYSVEQSMFSKRVLLADSDKKQQVIARMALGGSGVELDLVSSEAEGREKIANRDYDLVFFDTAMIELGNVAKAKNPGVGLVLMTSDQVPNYAGALKRLSAIPHIVSRDPSDRTFTIKNIMTTVTKLFSGDLFGLEKYLGWGVDIQSRGIVSTTQRQSLIQQVDAHFEALGIRRVNRDRINVVLEELLMNALYDAPVDEKGEALFNHMNRQVDLSLKPEQQGILRFGTDGNLIAVSVQDPFGSLKGQTILRYLEHNYTAKDLTVKVEENKGGAGLGLHQIVENSDLVVFNLHPGKKTEVIALFNVEPSASAQQTPSFHLFIKP